MPKEPELTKMLCVRVPPSLAEEVQAAADEERRPVGQLLRIWLDEKLELRRAEKAAKPAKKPSR